MPFALQAIYVYIFSQKKEEKKKRKTKENPFITAFLPRRVVPSTNQASQPAQDFQMIFEKSNQTPTQFPTENRLRESYFEKQRGGLEMHERWEWGRVGFWEGDGSTFRSLRLLGGGKVGDDRGFWKRGQGGGEDWRGLTLGGGRVIGTGLIIAPLSVGWVGGKETKGCDRGLVMSDV